MSPPASLVVSRHPSSSSSSLPFSISLSPSLPLSLPPSHSSRGLLGAHFAAVALKEKGHQQLAWYTDQLLEKAEEVGQRLLPAFNTTTGLPYPKVSPPRSKSLQYDTPPIRMIANCCMCTKITSRNPVMASIRNTPVFHCATDFHEFYESATQTVYAGIVSFHWYSGESKILPHNLL